MAKYSIEFGTQAAESKFNASSLFNACYNGLSEELKDELAAHELPVELDAFVADYALS